MRRLFPGVQIHLARAERRARRPAAAGTASRTARRPATRGQTHHPLVLGLVVPVREEDRHQPQRIDVRARRAALALSTLSSSKNAQPSSVVGFDRPRVELALERHPLELFVVVVVDDVLVERLGARDLDRPS